MGYREAFPFAEFVVFILNIYILDPVKIGDILSLRFRRSSARPRVPPASSFHLNPFPPSLGSTYVPSTHSSTLLPLLLTVTPPLLKSILRCEHQGYLAVDINPHPPSTKTPERAFAPAPPRFEAGKGASFQFRDGGQGDRQTADDEAGMLCAM